jgi:hypothetical protein
MRCYEITGEEPRTRSMCSAHAHSSRSLST